MIQFPIGKIVLIMVLLFILILTVFFLMRRWKSKRKEEQLEKLKEEFDKNSKQAVPETPEKDKEMLENIIEKITDAEEKEEKSIEIPLEEGYSLRLETADVIALETPQTILHKGFDSIRFKKIENMEDGVEIFFK